MRDNLMKMREQRGLRQEDVAGEVGISRSYYGHIENGNRNPSYGLAKQIAKCLGVEPECIFFDLDGFRMKQFPIGKAADETCATLEKVG
jgi:putative transcriptional regulator